MYYMWLGLVAMVATGLVAGTVAYRLSLVSRLLMVVISYILRKVDENGHNIDIEMKKEGREEGRGYRTCVVAREVVLKKALVEALGVAPWMQASGVSLDSLSVTMPSWNDPLKVVCSGLRVCISSNGWTKRTGTNSCLQDAEKALEERRRALALVDEILWGFSTSENKTKRSSIHQFLARYIGHWKSSALYGVVQFAIQCIHIELGNIEVYYMQQGEPGPRPSHCKYSGRDAAYLKIRAISLEPVSDVLECDNGSGMKTSWNRLMGSLSGKDNGNVSHYKTVSSANIRISGLSLDLLTYPDTWRSTLSRSTNGKASQFSFPKYTNMGISPEKQKLENFNNTVAQTFVQWCDDSLIETKLSLADEETHRIINQWEVSVVLRVIPPGLSPVEDEHCKENGKENVKQGDQSSDDEHGDLDIDPSSRPSSATTRVVSTPNNAFTIALETNIKALILNIDLAAIGVLERMAGRVSLARRFEMHWSKRPDVPVFSNEVTWWRHAGDAVHYEVKRLVRRNVSLSSVDARRLRRLQYQPLYVSKFIRNPMFRDPNRRWYQRSTVIADEAGMKSMENLEEDLTLEEIAHFRYMAAAKYNRVLEASVHLKTFTASKIDYIIAQLHLGNSFTREMLLHLDCLPSKEPPFKVIASVRCPKVSVVLDSRKYADEQDIGVPFFVSSLKDIYCSWRLGSRTKIGITSLEMGPTDSPTSSVLFTSVASPSLLCHRVCRAADFTRYTVTGHVRAQTINSNDSSFLEIEIIPKIGNGGITVSTGCEHTHAQRLIEQWRPAGAHIRVKVAAIGAKLSEFHDENDYSKILFSLIGLYRRSNAYTKRWNRMGDAFEIGSSKYPMLVEKAPTICDLVEDACSRSSLPTASRVRVSPNSLLLECPGVALQMPYKYKFTVKHRVIQEFEEDKEPAEETIETKSIPNFLGPGEFSDSRYMITAVIQNIRLSSDKERFGNFFDEGTIDRTEVIALIDIFSYLSEDERNDITHKLAPSRYIYDEDTREFKQVASGVSNFKQKLTELELTSMAKVWAYPEDMPTISKGADERTPSFDFSQETEQLRSSRSAILSGDLDFAKPHPSPSSTFLAKSRYPIPIVPFIKSYDSMASIASRISGMPQVPGESCTSIGLYVRAVQLWLSPIQLAHLKCMTETLLHKVREAGSALGSDKAEEKLEGQASKNSTETNTLQVLQVKVHVQQISLIWMIGTWSSNKKKGRKHLKTWGITVSKNDPAYLWGRWLAPLYSVSLSGLKISLRTGGPLPLTLKGGIRGIIARDLQLSELARHAYVLRPLPARTKRIFKKLSDVRKEAIGVKEPSIWVRTWKRATMMVMMRQAVDVDTKSPIKQLPSFDDLDLDTVGYQFLFDYQAEPANSDRDSSLTIEVGQMLGYIRIKQNASVAAFLSQISSLHSDSDRSSKDQETKKSGYQTGLRVNVNMVGLDFTGRFKSEDLFSLRLQQGYLVINKKRVSMFSNPEDVRMHISAKIDNLTLCDLRAASEHQIVLSPSYDAQYCSLQVHFTSKVDGKRHAPHLVVDIGNPRIMLLFRFVKDFLDGLEIITQGVSGSKNKNKAEHLESQVRAEKDADLPMDFILNVGDIDLILPTAQKKRSVLNISIKEIILSTPGSALPDAALEEANLPQLESVIEESIVCSNTFLYADFTRDRAKTTETKKPNLDSSDEESPPEFISEAEEISESAPHVKPSATNNSKEVKNVHRKRRQKSKRAKGVLLFEEEYDSKPQDNANVGVIQLPEDHSKVIDDNLDDNILSKPAAAMNLVGKALRDFVGQRSDHDDRISHPVEQQKIPDSSAIQIEAEDVQYQYTDDHGTVLPEASLALCIIEMKIVAGFLVPVPPSPAGGSDPEKATRSPGIYQIGSIFATDILSFYDVAGQDEFIEPINLGMVLFERNKHQQLHISLTDFRFVLSRPVYSTVMEFVGGNLGDFLNSNDGSNILRFKEIRYNEPLKFGPANNANVGFRFTLATPALDCMLASYPSEWMDSCESNAILPFFCIRLSNLIMNMISLDSGDTYMNFCSTQVDMQDLRLGYRLHKISNDIVEKETGQMEPRINDNSVEEMESPSVSVVRRLSNHSLKHRSSIQDIKIDTRANFHLDGVLPDMKSQNYDIPVIDFTYLPAIKPILGEDVACYRLLTTDISPTDRGHDDVIPGSNKKIRLEVSVGILSDSTMAVEIALSGGLLQWPYFYDVSLMNTITGIFQPENDGSNHEIGDAENIQLDITSWMYINVVISNTEIFVPVIDVDIASRLITELWNPNPSQTQRDFDRIADVILATLLVHSADEASVLSLEDRGISFDVSLMRCCIASGGDGELTLKTDLVDVAAFIRDPKARIHTVVQPMSASLNLKMQQPEASERHELKRLNHAASVIQKYWRRYYLIHRTTEILQGENTEVEDERQNNVGNQWKLVEKLAMDVATPRTRELLEDYYSGKGEKGAFSSHVMFKALSVRSINMKMGVFTCRLAFSHVPFWKSAVEGFNKMGQRLSNEDGNPVEEAFRPNGLKVAASFERIAVVLCNDKPETFGAPDVLNMCFSDGEGALDMASLLPDRPQNAVGNVSVTLFSSFLNSGSSKWEPLLSPWPVRAEIVDSNGSSIASDRRIHFWLSSERILDLTFNPASLMSIGDALAFYNSLYVSKNLMQSYEPNDEGSVEEYRRSVKFMSATGVSTKAPQKYLIQNQSGLKLYYWTEDVVKGIHKRSPVIGLEPDMSDTLKVVPSSKKLTLLNINAAASGTERLGSVINLHFEGNWMPIHDVPVNVVGKYKYNMLSPADNTTVPVLVDVILVGRTKIITVHSGIWVENAIEIPISFRLHVPTTSLAPPGVFRKKQGTLNDEGDLLIGPLKPGEGTFLPLVSALGGLLFLRPADYQEATRDVIRLSVNVEDLVNQQGYIVCDCLDLPGVNEQPLFVTMEVVPSRVLSEFQTFKHMEAIAPGTLQRVKTPLEVTISIQPTMVFSNALPYDMNVLLWQVGKQEDKGGPALGQDDLSFFEMMSPRASLNYQGSLDEDKGHYFTFQVPAGGKASVYADVRRDIFAHASLEDVSMRTVKWHHCNPSKTAKADMKDRIEKLPKSFVLRMLDVGLELPTEAFGIEHYLQRLKEGASQLRSLHARLRKRARKAVTSRDIPRSVAKIKVHGKKKLKRKSRSPKSAPPQTTRPAIATSARPFPPHSDNIPASSPPSNADQQGNAGKWPFKKLFAKSPGSKGGASPGTVEMAAVNDDKVAFAEEIEPYENQDDLPEYVVRRPPPLNVDLHGDGSDTSDDMLENNEMRVVAPPVLHICLHNTLAEKDAGSVSRVTFFVPFWMNNRTGVDLFYKDCEASSHPLGITFPWEYLEVFAPGTSLTQDMNGTYSSLENSADSGEISPQNVYQRSNCKVVLMNLQEDLALGLAHVGNRTYSQPVGIKTVGNKGTIELKGPVYQTNKKKSSSMPLKGEKSRGLSQDAKVGTTFDDDSGGTQEQSEQAVDGAVAAFGAMKVANDSTRGHLAEASDPMYLEGSEKNVPRKNYTQMRSFEFAVDVSAAPRNSLFRNTKLVNLKPKYIIENQTGISLDVKQVGTADPSDPPAHLGEGHRRFARSLPHGSRAAVYWDDRELPKEITIRPRLENEDPGSWNWSGSFPVPDTEWYFGLRVRHKVSQRRYINIPVNVTVGSSGSIQVTLKSPASVPPYRIENLCKDVQLFFVQVPLVFRTEGNQYVDFLNPRETMPYAWDEPTLLPKLRVQAKISGRQESRVADYSLDVLGDATTLLLPTQEEKEENSANRLYRSLSNEMSEELKQKLVSLLAAEFSKKVHATVFADGPTRVLRFSDDKNVSSTEHKHVVLDLAFRLKQIGNQLRDVNSQFARLGGVQGHQYFANLDLYGRFQDAIQSPKKQDIETAIPSRTVRKLPVPESTKQLVKNASKQILAHSRNGSGVFTSSVDREDLIGEDETPRKQKRIGFEAATPASTSKSKGTIHTASDAGIQTERYENGRFVGSATLKSESRDWGHLETGESSASRRSARRQATFQTSTTNLNINKRQELLKGIIVGDANLLVGGDLNITVVQAQNLFGSQRNTHAFARVRVRDAIPLLEGDERAKQTSVIWQSVDPIWDELVVFRDVCVASELVVELWDLGGTRSSKQLKDLSLNSIEVIKSCRFLGRAEIPLTETLDVPAMTPLWYPLMRRTARDDISGRVQLRFHWDVTTKGLMSIKVSAMESVLAQRREIIAALQPIQSSEAIAWRKPNPDTFTSTGENMNQKSSQVMPTMGLEMFRVRGEDNFSTIAFNPSESSIAVLNRHAQDHRQRHLIVSILEARGLNPRSGVVVALSDNELPNPVVTIQLPGYPQYSTEVAPHTLTPRWPANQRHIYRGVDPAKAELTIIISDQRNGLRRRAIPLGRGIVHASNVKGDRPTYIWVPAYPTSKKMSGMSTMGEHSVPDLQIFLRLQWQKKIDRGSMTKLNMDLEGAGIMVVGGLQDELFNFTAEKFHLDSVTTAYERSIRGSINSIQLDNQTLNAGEPVVLAPDTGLRPTALERPLIQFDLTQSFGASFSVSKLDKDMIRVEGCSKVGKIASSGTSQKETADIRSFKKFSLSIDPLHLQTDEVFMESLLSFLSSLPISDVWQDEAWQDQQYRLLTAQFGPKEVEALAVNAQMSKSKYENNEKIDIDRRKDQMALYWILDKENQDMAALQGQSNLSSWFFIESAEISVVKINVSISLSSRLLNAGQSYDVNDSGQFSRALGASGYQLVNVSNVEISLGKWMLGNDPSFRGKRTSNGFLSQRALINNLTRHYTRESLKEAHKVLGGAGPAIASVPLAVLWASGSAVVLLHEVSMGRAGPLGIAQQFVYVPIMTISMLLSGFSRMFAAGMVLIPPARIHGDDETVRRLVKRPNNAIDALSYIPREFILGFTSAGQGLLYDPIAGWHNGNVPGLFVGILKGVVGLPVRPLIGIFEATSNMTGAIAMTSLGREGIVGKTLKRVKAPGAFIEETIESLNDENLDESPSVALVAAWQRVLPEFFPEMREETVKQVINIRRNRVLLITTNYIAYLKAKHMVEHSVYRPKWVVPSLEIQNVQGDPETRKISIIHVRKYDLKIFGVWPVQMRKALRCENRSGFDRTVLRLTKVQQAVQAGKSLDEGRLRYIAPKLNEVTVLNNPYKSPTNKIEEL